MVNKINNLELTNLSEIINSDLLIYLDEKITNYKSGICAIDDNTYKPIITLIGLSFNYKYYSYKSFFLSEMVIHILDNFNSLFRYVLKQNMKLKNFYFILKKFHIVLLTKNYSLSKETIKLSYTNT